MYQPYPGQAQLPQTQRPLSTVDTLVGLTAPLAIGVRLWAVLVWLVALTAIVFLWRRSSSAYFKATPA